MKRSNKDIGKSDGAMEQVVLPIARVRLRRLSPTEIETLKSKSRASSNRKCTSQNDRFDPDIQRSSDATVILPPRKKISRQSSLKARANIEEGAGIQVIRNQNQKRHESEDDDDSDYSPDSDEMESLKEGKVQGVEKPRTTVRKTSDAIFTIKCQKCPAFFNSKSKFDLHNNSVHEDPSHQSDIHTCPICDRMIWRQLGFQTHLKYHTNAEEVEEEFNLLDRWPKPPGRKDNEISFSCKYCLMPHSSHHSFLTHMESKHINEGRSCNRTCRYCSVAEFNSIKLLVSHIKSDHRKEYYGSTKKWDSTNISIIHKDRPKSNCDICGELIDIYRMKLHKIKEHSGASSGTTRPNLKKKNNPSENKFQCPLNDCKRRLKTEQLLKQHFILHLKNNPFVCKIPGCGVRCGVQAHLNRHMRIHTGEKRVDCPKCGLSYSKKERLLVHVCGDDSSAAKKYADGSLRASRNRPLLKRLEKSEINSFQKTKDLKIGVKAGTKKKRVNINEIMLSDPVFINACERNSEFKRLMMNSVEKSKKALQNKPFECSECNRKYETEEKLTEHMETSHDSDNEDHDAPVFTCPKCEKELSCWSSLRRHCLSFHGLDISHGHPRPMKNNTRNKGKGEQEGRKQKREIMTEKKDKKKNKKQTNSDMAATVPPILRVKVELDLTIDADLNDEADSNQFSIPDASKIKVESECPLIKTEDLDEEP